MASERERKVRLLNALTDRIGVVLVVVIVFVGMEGMMLVVSEGYIEDEIVGEKW